MDTSQIRTNIASLPLLYNVWPNKDDIVIMPKKLLHTMEANSSAVILCGPDFLELQSEAILRLDTTVTYNVIYSFVQGRVSSTQVHSNSVLYFQSFRG